MPRLPQRLNSLLGTKPKGPNCYNAVQMFHSRKRNQKYTSPKKMSKWLLKRTKRVKKLRPKDIMVFHEENTLTHTAIYFSKQFIFHKRGVKGKYEFVTKKKVIKIYGSDWVIHRYQKKKSSSTTPSLDKKSKS